MNNKIPLILIGFIALVACTKEPSFSVSGTINDADGQTIYLEHKALNKTTIVDSCKIKKNGTFTLKAQAPSYPDFYNIHVAKQSIVLAIDSTEHVQIQSTIDSLPYTQNITGSDVSLQIAKIRGAAYSCTMQQLRDITKEIIIANPGSMAAYYALNLKQNGQNVWDITSPQDRRLYQAVATSFKLYMPKYERTKALEKQVLDQLQYEQSTRTAAAMNQLIAESENTFLDITLPDNNGKMQSLSKNRGKVIILDFSSINMEQYVAYNFELRDLYNKYHNRGLNIYSISIGGNQFDWEDLTKNLPWTTVFANEETAIQPLTQYNVQALPTLYIIDRKGNVQGRYADFESLEADINKYL